MTRRSLKAVRSTRPSADHGRPGWSLACVLAFVKLVFFSGGPSVPCYVRVAAFDRTASCSLARKGMIEFHFQLKSALIEI